jgi:phenylacetic acid degradation operon negative regulatory protein
MASSMKPRALILDLFGDYLRYVGSEVRAGDLATLLGALDVEPATTRVTLSRLRQEGWFTTRRAGRETIYRLSDHMQHVLAEGRERIFAEYDDDWDRQWTQVIVQTADADRASREQLKKRLAWLGFGSASTSTWLSPRDQTDVAAALRDEFPDAVIDVMRASTASIAESRVLAHRCWDLDSLDADYRAFTADQAALVRTADSLSGAAALAARTTLVSSYRHFPFRDPALPVELRPHGWAGAVAHDLFVDVHRRLAPAAVDYVESVIGASVEDAVLIPQNM